VVIEMKVLVIGAHGQVGQQLVRDLSAQGEEVYAGIRNMAQAQDFAQDVHAVALDVTGSVAAMTKTMLGMDAVIFAAGSGGKTGDDMTLRVDLDGAIKSMTAAAAAQVNKYILVSALYADQREKWPAAILPYYVAKYYSEEWLKRESGLNYLIIQPSTLLNEPARGTIAVNDGTAGAVTRADVAHAVAVALRKAPRWRASYEIVAGSTPIDAAF
jgi:uncharacterized protein YbjT (DUF2867 family)